MMIHGCNPSTKRLTQEDRELKASLSYEQILSQKTKNQPWFAFFLTFVLMTLGGKKKKDSLSFLLKEEQ
jgi:hypothetical protein